MRKRLYQPAPARTFVILCVLFFVFLTGCSHEYYTANVQQVPLFTEKHQLQVAGFIGGGNLSNTKDLQAAVSVTNHIAVMGSGMWINGATNNNASSFNYNNQMHGRYGEVAAGYFRQLNTEEMSGKTVFEVYGGVGASNQHHFYDSSQTATMRYIKYFIQPVIGLKRRNFEIGFSCRMSYVDFTGIDTNHTDSGFPGRTGYLFIEPALTVRGGLDFVKLQVQWQIITPAAGTEHTRFNYAGSMANFGIQFPISRSRQ